MSNEPSAADDGGAPSTPAPIDKSRRYFLIKATSVVGAAGVAGAVVPFVASWSPSAKARAAGAPVKIDFTRLQQGEMLGPIPAWRGKPIFVISRSDETLANLEQDTEKLGDANSDNLAQQPESARNPWRSQKPELGIYVGICTHLGCSPQYQPEIEPKSFDENWQGGFFCACHGSKFDLAGRVYSGVPAPDNLEVPPYRFVGDSVVIIGEEEGAA